MRTTEDLEPAIDAARNQAEALIVLTGALTNPHAVRVVELVTGSRLPATTASGSSSKPVA